MTVKRHRFTCPQCHKPWYFLGGNPAGHSKVICPSCLKVAHDQFAAELRYTESMLPRGYIEVPPELEALGLGYREFMGRLVAYRLGTPLEELLGPAATQVQ